MTSTEQLAIKMTSIRIISATEYSNSLAGQVGTLLFPDRWWDCSSYLDMKQVSKNVKRVNPLPKGARIKMVLVLSRDEPEFKNIANRVLPYRCAVCADQSYDGAYYKQYPEMNFAMWATDYPLGDAVVVYSTTKPKSENIVVDK
jgi:hypothetical protein